MKLMTRSFLVAAAAALICLVPSAKADSTLTLTNVAPDLANADGAYVGPYQGTVNGTAAQIICDDFADDSWLGEQWQATATNLASVASGPVKFGASLGLTQQQAYDAAALLGFQLLGASNSTAQIEYQFAIWELFDPSGNYSGLTSAQQTAINGLIAGAKAEALAPTSADLALFSHFTVYTPDLKAGAPTCNGGPCPTSPPQEFLVYTPEPSTLLMLGLGLVALCLMARRRNRTVGVPTVA